MAAKKLTMAFFTLFIGVAWLLGFVEEACAEMMKWKLYNYIVQMESLPVGDTEGHAYYMGSRRGLAQFENGDIAVFLNWFVFDITKGHGALQAYVIHTFEDGSTFVTKNEGTQWLDPKGQASMKGTGKFVKGTGRFEGIQGDVTFEGKVLVPYAKEKGLLADAYFDFVANYTLPRK